MLANKISTNRPKDKPKTFQPTQIKPFKDSGFTDTSLVIKLDGSLGDVTD